MYAATKIMRDLLDFLIKYSKWLMFAIYVIASCVLLFRNNPYQHHIFLTSANRISASVYGTAENVTSYFHLRDINDDLQAQNADSKLPFSSLKKN